MFYVTEYAFMILIAIVLAGDVTLIGNSETWHDALGRCIEQNSSLANITDIKLDNFCMKSDQLKIQYWVGNFYKLSNKISIKGCSHVFLPKNEFGYKSLHNCYELCTRKMKTTGLFAHKAVYGENCICDLHIDNITIWNMAKPTSSNCTVNIPLWWIYKVHSYYINTSNETCRQIRCNESQSRDTILRKTNCGQNSIDSFYNYLRSPVPQDELPYVCESNADNSTTPADFFRFGVNTSLKQDRIEKSTIILKCEAISCLSPSNFRVIQQSCDLKMPGFLCLKGSSISNKSTSSTTNIFTPTTPTIPYHLNAASFKEPMHNESASYGTSTITTQTTVPQQPINVTPNLWPGHVENSQIDITFLEGLHTTPSVNYSSVYTSIYTTSLDEMNMAESTTQTSEVIRNGHHGDSKIGIIVGSAVAVVVILVAAVLLVSCRLRHCGPFRKTNFDDDIQINELNDSNYQDNISITPTCNVHNTMYDVHTPSSDNTKFGLLDVSLDNSNNIRNNEYAVVLKNKQSGAKVVKQDCDTNGRNSHDMVENENDRNNHERPRSCDSSSNIRNNEYAVVVKNNQSDNQVIEQNVGMNAENSDDLTECEYDRLSHVRSRSGNNSSKIYDSALGFREECDATYNMTEYRGSVKKDDAVYDHA